MSAKAAQSFAILKKTGSSLKTHHPGVGPKGFGERDSGKKRTSCNKPAADL